MFVDLIARRDRVYSLLAFLLISSNSALVHGQLGGADSVHFRVEGPSQRLEMIANSSRILTLDKEVPRALVNNTEIVRVVPLSPNQVQVSAIQPGVTQINLWDESGDVHSVDVVVFGDARQLEMLIRSEFPNAALRVRPLAASVVLSGYVDRPEVVSRVIRLAEDYYPKVINNITVGGVQQVALHVKVMEVSRTKLRTLGFDWAVIHGENVFFQDVSSILNNIGDNGAITTGQDTLGAAVVGGDNAFYGLLEALKQNNLIKILAEPTLVTVSGRPASFLSGGEFPVLVPQSLGTISIEYKQFGTRVEFVPIVLGNGNIRLEVRPSVSELDYARGVEIDGYTIPGLRTRYADTAAEMRAGQTLAVAGLMQTRVESSVRGLPWLSDLPWAGAAFRRVQEESNDIELLIMVRPELVDAMEPHEVPCIGPGQSTVSPKDVDLYMRGYLEVPDCCPDANCDPSQRGMNAGGDVGPGAPAVMPLGQSVSPNGSAYPVSPSPNDPSIPLENALPQGASYGAPNEPLYRQGQNVQRSNASRETSQTPRSARRPASHGQATAAGLFGPTGYDTLR